MGYATWIKDGYEKLNKNRVGAKRVVKKNQSQDKQKMTGMYLSMNLALVQ